jgi:hypothetical protein
MRVEDEESKRQRQAVICPVELDGEVGRTNVAGGIRAEADGSDGVHVTGDVPGLDAITIQTRNGQDIVRTR